MKFRIPQNQAVYNEIANAKLYRLPDGRYYSNSPIMNALIYIESKGNANAKNPTSSATGLLQQITSNAKQYGLIGNGFDKRRDPFASFEAGKKFAIDNLLNYDRNGIASDAKKQYLAHQQGPGGALKILRGQIDETTWRNMAANAGAKAGGDFAGFWGKKIDQANAALAKEGIAAGAITGNQVTGELPVHPDSGQAQASYPGLTGNSTAPTPAPAPARAAQPLQELGVSYTKDQGGIIDALTVAPNLLTLPQYLYPGASAPLPDKRQDYG